MTAGVPTILVCGQLGSGKTSLLRHVMRSSRPLRFAAIVNDFGDVGIDGDLLRESTGRIVEVTGGCICCAPQTEMPATIQAMLQDYAPDYIVVEMSGEGDPYPVLRAVRSLYPLVDHIRCVTIVDLAAAPAAVIDDCALRNGILAADILILNKTDIATDSRRREWLALVASMNRAARRLPAQHAAIDPAAVLHGADAGRRSHDHHHRHEHQALHSYCFQAAGEVSAERVVRFMQTHAAKFVRIKGFVAIDGRTHEIQAVRERWSFVPYDGTLADRRTRVVFLSRRLDRDQMRNLCEVALASG
jgi:G3E family GTPase